MESLVLKAFRKKICILVKGSTQPTPYQGSCLILHSILWAALPACWLPCCPGHCSPAESCLTLYLPWVTSSCACNDLRALQNCSPAVLCHSIAARQHFLMHFHYFQLLFICRLFCSISSWVRVSLYYLMFFFLPSIHFCPASLFPPSYMKHFLIHCFVFPIVLHPMTHCTGNLSCLLRMFWRAGAEVWRERGVGEIQRSLEGDKIYAHFQALPADAPESNRKCCFFILCFLPGMEACCPPLLHEETSSMAPQTKKAQVQLSVFNLLFFLICRILSDENFPILLAVRCCDSCGDREEEEASHFACLWLVMMLMVIEGSPGRNPWFLQWGVI